MFSRTLPQPDRKCVSLGFVGRNQFVLFLEISADFKFQNVMFLFCVKLRKKENHLYFGSNTISFLLFQQLPPQQEMFFPSVVQPGDASGSKTYLCSFPYSKKTENENR
jgi:hypothetical protein